MSKPLLDVHPVSFRAYFSGSSRYQIVTTVLDHVIYNTTIKRKQILNKLKSDSLTAAVEDEIRAVCRELLSSPDCPQVVHQRLTTILVSRNNDDSAPTPSGCHLPPSCTLVVAINPEGTADQLWGSVASQLHQFSISTGRTATTMAPPRRSRRLTIMPEPAPAAPSSRARPAGRGSRSSRLISPVRRPSSPGAAPKPAAGRGRAATASPPPFSARQRTTGAAAATAAARRTAAARKRAASPVSTASTASQRSTTARSSRRSVAVLPPPSAASRRQTSVRRSKSASPPPAQRPRKSSLSPTKEQPARANRKIRSPSFAREIRVRTLTLRGVGNEMTDFNLPDGLTGSKKLLLNDLMANPTVVLETPGLLKRFSKKLTESSPPTKSAAKSPDRSAKSAAKSSPDAKVKRRRRIPSVSPVRVGGEQATSRSKNASPAAAGKESSVKPAAKRGRPSTIQKRARAESRSPSATPPKKTRVASGDGAEPALLVTAPAATDTDSPPPESLSTKRARPSLGSVRKSLNASLTAVPKTAASPASPVLRIHTPAVTPASTAAVKATRTITKVLRSVAESSEMTVYQSPRRSTAVLPPQLDSPERTAGVKALLAARSSIRRRPAGQPPPPEALSASPTLKPAREAASSALNRAYVALARSEAKQKDLFRSMVTGVAAAASPALVKPAEKFSSEKPTADETPADATSKKSAVELNTNQVVPQMPPVEPASDKPSTEAAPEKTGRSDAVDGVDAVFASPAGRGTPRGQLAPRSSVRLAPASALRRAIDRAPDSAARSSVRRVLRRPFPPPAGSLGQDMAAGGDSPLVEVPVTRSRRVKLASELHSPIEGSTELNNVRPASVEQPLLVVTQLSDEDETETPQRRGVIRTSCLMLLLLIVAVLVVLWLARSQLLPAQQKQQLEQLLRSVELRGQRLAQQLEQLMRQQTETVRGWMARQPAPPIPAADQ